MILQTRLKWLFVEHVADNERACELNPEKLGEKYVLKEDHADRYRESAVQEKYWVDQKAVFICSLAFIRRRKFVF